MDLPATLDALSPSAVRAVHLARAATPFRLSRRNGTNPGAHTRGPRVGRHRGRTGGPPGRRAPRTPRRLRQGPQRGPCRTGPRARARGRVLAAAVAHRPGVVGCVARPGELVHGLLTDSVRHTDGTGPGAENQPDGTGLQLSSLDQQAVDALLRRYGAEVRLDTS